MVDIKIQEIVNGLDWDNLLKEEGNASPYQQWGWRHYKEKDSWQAKSLKLSSSKGIAYVQIQFKIKLGVLIGFISGLPTGDITLLNPKIISDYLKKNLKVYLVYIRTSFIEPFDDLNSFKLYCAGWGKCKNKINSDYTIYINLNNKLDDIQKGCSSNWRKNLKKGLLKNENIELLPLSKINPKVISDQFVSFKSIKDVQLPSLSQIEFLKDSLGEEVIVAIARKEDEVIGLRAYLFFENRALDFWATSDNRGRKQYTSFALLWKLLDFAKSKGVQFYDMSGIDPVKGPTVYNFKNGMRCPIKEKIGEWEYSSLPIFNTILGKLTSRR
jgi:lipid II:glycine glycyltransferase (peptidoglycan interpeptide bridge formation enzyme)